MCRYTVCIIYTASGTVTAVTNDRGLNIDNKLLQKHNGVISIEVLWIWMNRFGAVSTEV